MSSRDQNRPWCKYEKLLKIEKLAKYPSAKHRKFECDDKRNKNLFGKSIFSRN